MAAVFVPTDTTCHHFQHFRRTFTLHVLPVAIYPEGLARFGPTVDFVWDRAGGSDVVVSDGMASRRSTGGPWGVIALPRLTLGRASVSFSAAW